MVVWQPACAPQIQDLSLDLVVTVVGFVDAGQPLDLGAVIELAHGHRPVPFGVVDQEAGALLHFRTGPPRGFCAASRINLVGH
jgi:hypothetical protein